MPWVPELFSAPALAALEERRQQEVVDIPYFEGLVMGEVDALVESFAGEPRILHPLRGRIEGEKEFREFVADTGRLLEEQEASVEDVRRIVLERRGFEEVVVHLDVGNDRINLPHGLVADHSPDGRIVEIRTYFSTRPLIGRRAERAPLLRADPDLREPAAVGRYVRALARGDAAAVAATFEADGEAREPGAADRVHSGAAELRAFFANQFGGAIELEPCVAVEDGEYCALEYNAGRRDEPARHPGLTVFVGGAGGKLAAARIYDDFGAPSAG
jgi:hypothetical protein